MRTISVRIEFDSLVEDGSYDAVEKVFGSSGKNECEGRY